VSDIFTFLAMDRLLGAGVVGCSMSMMIPVLTVENEKEAARSRPF
jgi:hypothetical protein